MPWNGVGGASVPFSAIVDAAASVPISSTHNDGNFSDVCTMLQNCLTRDGQTPPLANVPFGGFKGTGLANGTVATDAATYGQVTGITTGNAFRKNALVNGDFMINQTTGWNTAVVGTAARIRAADCWWGIRQGTTGYRFTAAGSTFGSIALNWQRTAGDASVQDMLLAQSVEAFDTYNWRLRAVPVTFSFYAKKGANYSGGNLTVDLITSTSTIDKNVLDGFTGQATAGTASITLTTTLTRYFVTVASLGGTTRQLAVRFKWTPTGVAGADDAVYLECCQLEAASAPTDFEFRTFADTLQACKRYYEKSFDYSTAPAQNSGAYNGVPTVGAGAVGPGYFPVVCVHKRESAALTVTTYNPAAANAQVRNITRNTDGTGTGGQFLFSKGQFMLTWIQPVGTVAGDILGVAWVVNDPDF